MGRVLRLVAAGVGALALVSPAAAHTDGGQGLYLQWPASGTITRGFGYDGSRAEWHPGIDIGTLRSLDITAAAPGVVEAIGYVPHYEGYGEVVLVDLGDGLEALYAHLSWVSVHQGEHVLTGQKLGNAGCTGYCTGTHLHFEMREGGEAFDPAPLLPATIP